MVYTEINNTVPVSTKQERLILQRRNLQIQMYELEIEIVHTLTKSQITTEWESWVDGYWGEDFDVYEWAIADADTSMNRPWTRYGDDRLRH